MGRAFGCVLSVVLAFSFCPASMAQDAAANAGWDACRQAPTRNCILEEALTAMRSVKSSPQSALQLGKVAEAQAAAGNIQGALEIARSIPYYEAPDQEQSPRVAALLAIADAQARRGREDEAKETLIEARRVANSLKDQLGRAEALQSISVAQAGRGMAAEAMETFRASLKLAEDVEIQARSRPCGHGPSPQRLDALLRRMTQQTGESRQHLRVAPDRTIYHT
jgi:tetratricopeptide (TPR) repeat protein